MGALLSHSPVPRPKAVKRLYPFCLQLFLALKSFAVTSVNSVQCRAKTSFRAYHHLNTCSKQYLFSQAASVQTRQLHQLSNSSSCPSAFPLVLFGDISILKGVA